MEHSEFVVKCYNKQELAQMYFPDLTIRASVNKLRRWMRRCKPLMNEILSTDFIRRQGIFCERGTAYYLLFRKAGRVINAVIIESLNDINIKKELRETALSPAPVVLFIYPYTPCDCQNRDKPYESKH